MLLLLAFVTCGCSALLVPNVTPEPVTHKPEEANIVGWFDTLEEAEEAAKLYGIELVYYNMNSLFYTDKDPQAVVDAGAKNGWPELSVNSVIGSIEVPMIGTID